ncbi:NB-ARC domain-containing disease resistance protein [Prunus dulcis]|uniref:NB-ARC domain-containing disease resistance protein n=1 Tax=Prunus dulcis TaxID=3755 RepID=A0A4Y1R3F5_PRUDU|nr:NB-ARC domain-containing disease resistance protein [Prunus dulcis]
MAMKSAKLAKRIEPHEKVEFSSVFHDVPQEEIFDTPSEDYMAFESRISKVKEIMEELRNLDTNLIGVYGLGGVGKSTLAKEVYRQARKENIRSRSLKETKKIQKKIAEKLGMDVEKTQDMHIWNRIKDKKSLIILDDVWEAIDLEVLGLRPMATCKILFTSRVRVSKMRAQKEFWLDVLGEKESWSLFEKMAGDVVKDDPIKEVATQVAQKCGGLPVLVVTVASTLRLNSSLEVWKDTLRRFKRFDGKELTEKACLAIEWSYNRLDAEELQPLFLLCGIIAVGGRSIYLFYLLHCAMGLGLIKKVDTLEEARNALHLLAKKLKDSCLLLDGNEDGTVRMHELVRDVAILIASKDKHAFSRAYGEEVREWPNRDFLEKCYAISLNSCKIPRLPEVPWVCLELKFFCLESSDNSLEIPSNFFEEMKELKVLDVTGLRIPSLPPSLQSLTNLQTLCLYQCELRDIALVGRLTNLKILSLVHSQVKELPKEIGQLTRLQLLDLSYCSVLVKISPGIISSLTSLEDLRIGSFKEWEGGLIDERSNASVSELEQLHQLTALHIHIPDAKLLPANMFSDTKLERYTILIGDCWQYPDNYETSSNILKLKLTRTINSTKRCEDLDLDGMEAENIIAYISASDKGKQLKKLHVQNSDEVTAVINSSHAFPNLESLSLDNLVNLETVCCGQLIAQPFQKLRSLTLRNLPKLIGFSSKGSSAVVSTEVEEIILENEIGGPTKVIMNGEVMMPNLTRLIVHGCSGLRFLFSFSMARSLVELTHLEIASCQIMEEIVTKIVSSEENTDNIFRKLKHLQLQHLPSLTRFCSGSYVEFPSLELLHLEDCSELGVFIFHSKSENVTAGKQTEERDMKNYIETDVPYFLLDEKVGFPSLERLRIYDMHKLRTIWHRQLGIDSFRKLKIVHVRRCDSLINIFAPTSVAKGLQQLSELYVQNCGILEEIVAKEGVETTPTEEFVFPKGNPFPNLENLKVYRCARLKNLTSSAISFGNLTTLDIWGCGGLKYLTTYSVAKRLQQLKNLEVEYCESMIEIVASNGDEQDSGNYYEIAFSSLQHLKLYDLPILRGFCSSEIFTIRVPSLNSLIVEKCLIELKISPDKSLIQSSSRPERQQITEEVEEKEVEEEDGYKTGGKQLIAHTIAFGKCTKSLGNAYSVICAIQ